ncbi:MAG TPA: hypothetical protein VFM77_00070 [Terriglobales bacterium]|nr:hypothetical protein [Terriglobales bacterium]
MSTSPTVPIIDPHGQTWDIPYDQMHAALAKGGKMGVFMHDPEGQQWVIPADKVQDAVKAGGKIVPYNLDVSHQDDSFWNSYGGELKNLIKGAASAIANVSPANAASLIPAAAQIAADDEQRRADNRSAPYRAVAATGSLLGINARGMEEEAAKGNTKGVLGVAAADATPYAAGPVVGEIAPKATAAARAVTENPLVGKAAARAVVNPTLRQAVKAGAQTADIAGGAAIGGTPGALVGKFLRPTERLAQTISKPVTRWAENRLTPAEPLSPAEAAEGSTWREPEPVEAQSQSQPAPTPQAAPVSKKVPTGGTAAPSVEDQLMQQRFRLGHLQDSLRSASPEEIPAIQTEIDATKDTLNRLNPRAARPQPAAQKQSYPEGIQKRPTERGEVISDKAIEDAMRNDLERHGWSALSQERKEFYANNQPGMAKGDLVTQARVDAIRAEAEQRVQQVLAEQSKPVKYTKTKTPKAKAAAAPENITPDLNNPDVLMNLMKRSLKDLSGK